MIRNRPAGLVWIFALGASILAVAMSVPPLRALIEQSMTWHMVIQMPMLVLAGWLVMQVKINSAISRRLDPWNRYGLTGLISAQVIIAYWMLPLAIDQAVVQLETDLLKLVTLFVCGAMLRHSAERAPVVLQLFFVGYLVSMMSWLGLYFATTNLRLCNAYSLESQLLTGWGIVILAVTISLVWSLNTIPHTKALLQKHLAIWRQRPAPP
jgi:hypothetical protein